MIARDARDSAVHGATPTEIEASLAIVAKDPDALAAKLGRLRQLGGYALVPRPELLIRDTYLDTPDMLLMRRLFSVRLRQANDRALITLKGDDPSAGPGIKVRSELELPWGEEALARVREALATQGIRLAEGPTDPELAPLERLAACGLVVVQERATRRVVRDVLPPEDPGAKALAELVIDQVTFTFGAQVVRHSEVEVELKAATDRAILDELLRALRALAPRRLMPWSVPKLALGLALERLLAQGALQPHLAADGSLSPAAYRAFLAQRRG